MIPGLGILRLALVTAVFYVGLAVVIEASLFLLAHFQGSVVFAATRTGCWFLFALLWLVAFALAWHFVPMGPMRAP